MLFDGKVQLFATPRSGSNFLHNLITKYMNVCPYCIDDHVKSSSPFSLNKEDYDPTQRSQTIAVNKRVETIQKGLSSVWKTHPYALDSEVFNFKGFNIKTTVELSDYNVLLTRRDILEVILSAAIAREKQSWRPPFDDDKIHIEPENFKLVCKEIFFGHYLNLVKNPYNIKANDLLFFEDTIVSNTPEQIFSSLSLCNVTKDELPKILDTAMPSMYQTPPKEEIIKNYDQLVDLAKEQYVDLCIADITDMITINDDCYITQINLESYKINERI